MEKRIPMPSRTRPSTLRTNGIRCLIITVVIGLLVWSWRDLSLTAVGTAIARWGWREGLLFGVLNIFILAAMCWRWSFILHQLQFPVPFGSLILYRMGANTLSYVTPGPQFGGEPLQVYCLTAKHGVPPTAASAAVAVDRLVELAGNLLFLSIAAIGVLRMLAPEAAAVKPALAITAGVGLGAALLLGAMALGCHPVSRLVAWGGRRTGWSRKLARLIDFVQASESRAAPILTPRHLRWYALAAAVQWGAFLAELGLIYAFLGVSLSAPELLTLAVAARLAFLVPLPGGWGILEAGQVAAFAGLGGDPTVAMAACLIMRARDLVLIAAGAGLLVRWLRPLSVAQPKRRLDVT
ncbi:MAG: lysylphosphatidylglycerol synthase transmembrane domain-containing protein [Desulfobacterales bacterium]|nr:lysylphosphatidylglycerol synthase transmembrane domain-containing protein [Desulfobacterales bacterium]